MEYGSDDPLLGLARLTVEHHGFTCAVVGDEELAIGLPGGGERLRMHLANLRQWTAQEPRDQWPAIVSDFVGSLVATIEDADGGLDLDDYAVVRPLLRTRLYGDDHDAGHEVMRRPVAPGLIEVLAVDKPTTLLIVSRDLASTWGRDPDELFATARENVRRDGPLEVGDEDVDGVRVFTLGGETAYVSAHAVWAGDYPVTGPYGALVVLPAQGVLHAAPIHGMDVLPAMNLLIPVAWGRFQEGPRPITPHVYWWRDGALLRAGEVGQGEESLSVTVGPEFQELLEALAGE